jgi:hypothetical protein
MAVMEWALRMRSADPKSLPLTIFQQMLSSATPADIPALQAWLLQHVPLGDVAGN